MIDMLTSGGGRTAVTYDDDDEVYPYDPEADAGRTTITYDDDKQEELAPEQFDNEPDQIDNSERSNQQYIHPALTLSQEELDAACYREVGRPS